MFRKCLAAIRNADDQLAMLRSLLAENKTVLAREFGIQMIDEVRHPDEDETLWLTGLAAMRTFRFRLAETCFKRALLTSKSTYLQEVLYHLAIASDSQFDNRLAQMWVRAFRSRFPHTPLPQALEFIESGLSEGIGDYHQNRLSRAVRAFERVLSQTETSAVVRQKALYFLALSLFRARHVSEAVEQMSRYRENYGENADFVELTFRQGESLLRLEPDRARQSFRKLLELHPDSYWASLAREHLRIPSTEGVR